MKVPCDEFVTIKMRWKVLTRKCRINAQHVVTRETDGDLRRVCGVHRRQLCNEGWREDLKRTMEMRILKKSS